MTGTLSFEAGGQTCIMAQILNSILLHWMGYDRTYKKLRVLELGEYPYSCPTVCAAKNPDFHNPNQVLEKALKKKSGVRRERSSLPPCRVMSIGSNRR